MEFLIDLNPAWIFLATFVMLVLATLITSPGAEAPKATDDAYQQYFNRRATPLA